MSGEARHDNQPINWVLPPGMRNRAFSGVIDIDWITRYMNLYTIISIEDFFLFI